MPISDVAPYDEGHFDRVYKLLIQPAAKRAGFKVSRADKSDATNFIVIDIIEQIMRADMVICDLSSGNTNVLYELGIRHALPLPVTLIKDSKTRRGFDTQGIRDEPYDESLRADLIKDAIERIAKVLKNTYANRENGINSPIQLVERALVLKTIGEGVTRFKDLEPWLKPNRIIPDKNDILIEEGSRIRHPRMGEGTVRSIDQEYVVVVSNKDHKQHVFRIDGPEIREAECIFDS